MRSQCGRFVVGVHAPDQCAGVLPRLRDLVGHHTLEVRGREAMPQHEAQRPASMGVAHGAGACLAGHARHGVGSRRIVVA
jgi:hypothetical protein